MPNFLQQLLSGGGNLLRNIFQPQQQQQQQITSPIPDRFSQTTRPGGFIGPIQPQSPVSAPRAQDFFGPARPAQTQPQSISTGSQNQATGPGGIAPGSYRAETLSQEQRQFLWEFFGHSGPAPTGYGGEDRSPEGEQQADDLISSIVDTFDSQLTEFNRRATEFDEANPFIFDEILTEEKEKVSQRLDPHFNQTLTDFLQGIDRKRTRAQEDETLLVGELQADTDTFRGRNKRQLDRALNSSREGFADSGLFFSGRQLRETGNIEIEGEENLSDFLRGQGQREADIGRTGRRLGEDITTAERLGKRDVERERQAQTEAQALGEVQTRQKRRAFEKFQVTGAPPGADPLEFQNLSFNLLGA